MNKLSGFAILLFTVFLLSVYSTTYVKKASAISFGTGPCPSGEARDYVGICFPVKECKASLFARPGTCTVTTSPTSSKESNNGNTQESNNGNTQKSNNAGNGATSEESNNTLVKQEQQKTIMLPSTTVHLNQMEKIQQSQQGNLLCPACSSKPSKVESAPTTPTTTSTTTEPESQTTNTRMQPAITAPNAGSAFNLNGPKSVPQQQEKHYTAITLKVTPSTMGASSYVLTGRLTSEGKGLSGKTIDLSNEGTNFGRTVTGPDGTYSFTTSPSQVRTSFNSPGTTLGADFKQGQYEYSSADFFLKPVYKNELTPATKQALCIIYPHHHFKKEGISCP